MLQVGTLLAATALLFSAGVMSQVDEGQLGGWYSWFYNRNIEGSPWATQMIIQRRNWDTSGDLQQRMILGQASIRPEGHLFRYGLGYYHLRHGEYGPSKTTRDDHVLFQQGIVTDLWGERNFMTFRLRLEEHWPEGGDDFRRLRGYASINRPMNQATLDQGALYLSFYEEYFLDLEPPGYAQNRVYAGLGYKMTDHTSWQVGLMRQNSRSFDKNQFMIHLFHHY